MIEIGRVGTLREAVSSRELGQSKGPELVSVHSRKDLLGLMALFSRYEKNECFKKTVPVEDRVQKSSTT